MKRTPLLILAIVLTVACSTVYAGEILYFKNNRAMEALDYYVNNGLIYITMTNGLQVYMRESQVDWEATERIKQGNIVFRKMAYEAIEDKGEESKEGMVSRLTNTDLKKGMFKRQASRALSVVVQGDRPWTDSGIDLKRGQQIILSGHGTIKLWKTKDCPAQGIEFDQAGSAGDKLLSDKSFGSLVGKIGSRGRPFYCGSRKTLTAPIDGRLYLGPNDLAPEDNSGAWDVKVQSARARKYAPGFSTGGYTMDSKGAVRPGAATQGGPKIRQDLKRARPGY